MKDNIINQRIHLGDGKYHQRGLCKGIKEGDTLEMELRSFLVTKIILIRDAKANNWAPEQCKDAYYEAELQELDMRGNYYPLPNYTFNKKDTDEILNRYKTN